jgi:hypothetical protein
MKHDEKTGASKPVLAPGQRASGAVIALDSWNGRVKGSTSQIDDPNDTEYLDAPREVLR